MARLRFQVGHYFDRYSLWDRGTCIEEFDWGCDYTEEVFGIEPQNLLEYAIEREKQGNPIPSDCDPRRWDIYCFSDLSSYRFRSTLNTATETEVIETYKFLDTLLRTQNAWLPDWDYLPHGDGGKIHVEGAKAEDFVRIDLILGEKWKKPVLPQNDTHYDAGENLPF